METLENIHSLERDLKVLQERIELERVGMVTSARAEMFDKKIATPTQEELREISIYIADVYDADVDYTERLLQSFITFKMEEGIRL